MQLDHLIRKIRRFAENDPGDTLSDRHLLDKFLATRDELAFEELLQRHGPMVLRLCRRLLPDPHRADDAFQATFLTLVAKGDSIEKRDAVGSWLYGVAYRVATRARAQAAQLQVREEAVLEASAPPLDGAVLDELRPVLDEEVQRLPDKYRVPVILCYLEGKTNEQAAQELHCPAGTVKTRLSRARDLLRSRLTRRGVALSATALAASLENALAAAPPPTPFLMSETLQAARGKKPGTAEVAQLVAGAVRDLPMGSTRKLVLWGVLTLAVLGGSLGLWLHLQAPPKPPEPERLARPAPEKERQELPVELGVLPQDASLFATFRIGALFKQDFVKKLRDKAPDETTVMIDGIEKGLGCRLADLDTFTHVVDRPHVFWDVFAVQQRNQLDRKKVLAACLPGGAQREIIVNGKSCYELAEVGPGLALWQRMCFLGDKAFAIGLQEPIDEMVKRPVRARAGGKLRDGLLLAAQDSNLVVVACDPSLIRADRDFPEIVEQLPMVRPLLPLLDADLVTCSVRIDKGELLVNARAVFDKNGKKAGAAAQQGVALIRSLVPVLKKKLQVKKDTANLLDQLDAAIKDIEIKADDKVVTAALRMKLDADLVGVALAETLVGARAQANRINSINNLRQMVLAMHIHHNNAGKLPAAAIVDKQGKPLLSWRVAMLPYIEQGDIYKKFKLDEPWDSAHNKKLIAAMPPIFVTPGRDAKPGHTFYRVFTGKQTPFDGAAGLNIAQILDGASQTILIVEAGEAVPWTKPEELPYLANKALPALGSKEGFAAAFADGHVQFITKIDAKTLRALITPKGNEQVELPE